MPVDDAVEARLPPHYRLHGGSDCDHEYDQGGDAPKRPRVRYMPPLEAPLLSQIATMKGFLKKQADNEPGRWTQYYFVLKPATYLYYYNTELDADPRGIIDVEFLKDVRFNTDCVQRGVGASANGFRVTGQLPREFSTGDTANAASQASQLRPLYLDAESREAADAWMDAIRHHRFDLGRYNDYEDLLATMDVVDERLTALTEKMSNLKTASQRILKKGGEYLQKLRGEEIQEDDQDESPAETPHTGQSAEVVVRLLSELLDDVFAEAEHHRRLAELLREHETEHFQREAQLKGCEADLKVQSSRYQVLESELEKLLEEKRVQAHVYEERLADIVTRETWVATREKELDALTKQRDRECELKMQESERRAVELAKELKKETARCNVELEKRRKALDKQQKDLEQKQKQLDKKLKQSPALKVGIVEAVRKSLSNSASTNSETNQQATSSSSDHEDAVVVEISRQQVSMGSGPHECGSIGDQACIVETNAVTSLVLDTSPDEPVVEPAAPRESLEQKCESREDDQGARDVPSHEETQACVEAPSDSSVRLSPSICSAVGDEISLEGAQASCGPIQSTVAPASATSTADALLDRPGELGASMLDRLPPEWTCMESKSYHGQVYYFNVATGETRWDFPLDVALEDPASTRSEGSVPPDESLDAEEPHRLESGRSSYLSSGHASVTSQSDMHEADKVERKKTPWKMMLAKVQLSKSTAAPSSSPRSLLDRSLTSEPHRYEF